MDIFSSQAKTSGEKKNGRIANVLRGCVRFLYESWIEPKSKDEDKARREFILNTVLVGLICTMGFLVCSIAYNLVYNRESHTLSSLIIFLSVFCFFFILLGLSRKGRVRLASYILITLCVLVNLRSEYIWGMSLPAGLLGHAFIITMSVVVISARFGIYLSLGIGAALSVLAYREHSLQIISQWKYLPVPVTTGIQYAFLLFLMTIISWLYAHEIQKSLTRARNSEKALQEKNDSLEQIVEERTKALKQTQIEKMSQLYRFVEFGKLSSGVFHDLLNPLSALNSNIQSLRSSLQTDIPEIKEQIDTAVKASERMQKFMGSLKKQVETQQTASFFCVNDEIEEAIVLFEYKARQQGILIEFLAEERSTIFGNPLKFHQVIANLISNAVDSYISKANAANTENEKVARIELHRQKEGVEIVVTDHGAGINSEDLAKIFDPFFSTKHQHGGIGLGLSTTKHIMDKDFHGTISVKSIPGSGSRFIVFFPYQQPQPENIS